MKKIEIYNRKGLILNVKNKYCVEDIEVIPSFPVSSDTDVQLFPPSVVVSGDLAGVRDTQNGAFANSWRVYANGQLLGEATAITGDAGTNFRLDDKIERNGTYLIQAKAFGDLLLPSELSTGAEYIRAIYTEGLEYNTSNDLWSVVGFGTATDDTIAIAPTSQDETVVQVAFDGESDCKEIIFPDTIEICDNIGTCPKLETLEFGVTTNKFKALAFTNAPNIQNVNYKGTLHDWCNIDFTYEMATNGFYAYETNPCWNGAQLNLNGIPLPQNLVIPNTKNEVKNSTFLGFNRITSLTLPNTVKTIGFFSFGGCSSLQTITFSNTLVSIGMNAFDRCVNLTSITLPDTITMIDKRAFYGCTSLDSVTLGAATKNTTIGNSAFDRCTSLALLDCRQCAGIPVLYSIDALLETSENLKIVVPDKLYSNWVRETNWSYFANNIISATDYKAQQGDTL